MKLCPCEETRIEIIETKIRIGIEIMEKPIKTHGIATFVNVYLHVPIIFVIIMITPAV